MLDLRITHERFGSSSDPSLNGHLHYPNDIDRSLKETTSDKNRKYRTDYNNNPPNSISFMPVIGSTRTGTKFSTVCTCNYVVNSLDNCTCTERAVPFDIPDDKGGQRVTKLRRGGRKTRRRK
jgi:hypothetical protein